MPLQYSISVVDDICTVKAKYLLLTLQYIYRYSVQYTVHYSHYFEYYLGGVCVVHVVDGVLGPVVQLGNKFLTQTKTMGGMYLRLKFRQLSKMDGVLFTY